MSYTGDDGPWLTISEAAADQALADLARVIEEEYRLGPPL